jgi:hypothetical protein
MTNLPASPLWRQALNWMVTGEPRDCDPVLLDIEAAYAAAFNEERPVQRMSLERARSELLDRLESGVAIATGQLCEAIGVNGYRTESLPSPIPSSAWVNLRIDDETNFAEIDRLQVSIPGQGYANVRLRRDDVVAAFEAVQRSAVALEDALLGLLGVGGESDQRPDQTSHQPPPSPPDDVIKPPAPITAKRWLDQYDGPFPGQAKMWDEFRKAGGNTSRARFFQLRKEAVQTRNIETRRVGAPRKIDPDN